MALESLDDREKGRGYFPVFPLERKATRGGAGVCVLYLSRTSTVGAGTI